MSNYLEIAKKVGRGGSRDMSTSSSLGEQRPRTVPERKEPNEEAPRPGRTAVRPKRQKPPAPQRRGEAPLGALGVEEALKEMERAKGGPGIQARLYRAGEISRENAVRWIACAIIYRREGREAPFDSWKRHAKAVEQALNRFCEGGA